MWRDGWVGKQERAATRSRRQRAGPGLGQSTCGATSRGGGGCSSRPHNRVQRANEPPHPPPAGLQPQPPDSAPAPGDREVRQAPALGEQDGAHLHLPAHRQAAQVVGLLRRLPQQHGVPTGGLGGLHAVERVPCWAGCSLPPAAAACRHELRLCPPPSVPRCIHPTATCNSARAPSLSSLQAQASTLTQGGVASSPPLPSCPAPSRPPSACPSPPSMHQPPRPL